MTMAEIKNDVVCELSQYKRAVEVSTMFDNGYVTNETMSKVLSSLMKGKRIQWAMVDGEMWLATDSKRFLWLI